jgi:hypothetical protein
MSFLRLARQLGAVAVIVGVPLDQEFLRVEAASPGPASSPE